MDDFTNAEYAPWLEGVIQELFAHGPEQIGIFWRKGNIVGTAYYGMQNEERSVMIQSVIEDSLLQYLAANRKYIHDLLSEDEEDEE